MASALQGCARNNNRAEAAALSVRNCEVQMSNVRWQRIDEEPFEYAIQQGPHGDAFVKLLDGSCLRRAAPNWPLDPLNEDTEHGVDMRDHRPWWLRLWGALWS